MNKILPFDIVKPARGLENLSAFLTFSQKQWNRHMRGVRELGRPFLILMWQFIQNAWRGKVHLEMRGLHARCVKISRITHYGEFSFAVFIGIFPEKSVGIGGAKAFFRTTVSMPQVELANCHLNEKNQNPLTYEKHL